MATLHPYPFAALIRRAFSELERKGSIFDLPARRFARGDPRRDVSVRVHGGTAACPLGPAAGPHTQLAQNIVLSWLAGGRAIELKTVQILDDLRIERPCIDMETVGFNIEWSQELTLEQSLEEYVKASMLIDMLIASGALGLAPGFERTVFDISVGYDLAGVSSARVRDFLRGITAAGPVIDRLRAEIPEEWARYRDLAFRARLAGAATLSTFHGCPPGEIEAIARLLLREHGLSCTIKLNPTLLGRAEATRLLHDALGYHEIRVPEGAFERDAAFEQVVPMIERLGAEAAALGLHAGVKFTNTLVVENHRHFFPGAKEMYLSGPPLHVLAMHLVRRFRRELRDRVPISFSGGIDAENFPDAVALGLAPVTVCTDWLKTGGYGRAHRYFDELFARMDRRGARTRDDFIIRAHGHGGAALAELGLDAAARRGCEEALEGGGDLRAAAGAAFEAWVSEAALLNTETYVETVAGNPRYAAAATSRPPKKIGRHLTLFDCIACDKCVPVCPNDANFVLPIPAGEIPILKARPVDGHFEVRREGAIALEERHQIGNFIDLCNACGNCDVFCPEEGGPYKAKPRFFGSLEGFRESPDTDGFLVERRGGRDIVLGRLSGVERRIEVESGRVTYEGRGFRLCFDEPDPEGTLEGTAEEEVDLTPAVLMNVLRKAVLSPRDVNFVSCLV